MKAGFFRAVTVAFALTALPVQAQTCPELPATTLTSFIAENKMLTFSVSGILNTAWQAYVAAPDDDKLEAVLFELGLGGAGLAVPGLGILIKAGRVSIRGVEYTIEEARRMQIDAFLCGGVSGGERLPGIGFFDTPGAQAISRGINCSNFAERITTPEQFERLETLFKGFYTRNVLEMGGRQNRDGYTEILAEQWALVERTWKVRMGARLLDRLRSDLARLAAKDAEALAASCPARVNIAEATGEDGAAQVTAANFTWMWEFRPVTFNGQFSGSTKTGWTFNGDAVDGVAATVSCTGGPADLSEFGVEPGGGGRLECTAQFPATQNAGSATWHGTGQGRIDWDGFLLKGGGKGVRIDGSGTTEAWIEVLYLRPGHVPLN